MKRLLSWLLALVMIISCLPMSALPAFATEEAPEVETGTEDPDFPVDFSELTLGMSTNPYVIVEGSLMMGVFTTISVEAGKSVYATADCTNSAYTLFMNTYDGSYNVVYNQMTGMYWAAEGDADAGYSINQDLEMGGVHTLVIQNTSDVDITIMAYLTAIAEPGTWDNPAEAVLGDNSVDLEADNQGYFYTYTAEKDGNLVITTSSDVGYSVTVNTPTSYGDKYDCADGTAYAQTVAVTTGDVITIIVGTYGTSTDDSGAPITTAPAGTVTVNLAYEPTFTNLTTVRQAITVPAGDYAYGLVDITSGAYYNVNAYCIASGSWTMGLFRNVVSAADDGTGTYAATISTDGMTVMNTGTEQLTITFYNSGEEDITVMAWLEEIQATEPEVGTLDNPAEAVLGDNSVDLEADNQGYVYTYTAEKDGNLTISMVTETDWSYAVNANGSYGTTHYYDDETVVSSETIAVTAGDVVQIIVGTTHTEEVTENGLTYDKVTIPAGNITINLAYEASIEKFGWAGMSVELKDSLAAKFVMAVSSVDGDDNYAVISKEVYDKTTDSISIENITVPQSEWGTYGSYLAINYNGVAAKMMMDEFTVVIYNGNGQQISEPYTRTIEDYLYGRLTANVAQTMKNLAVDFLNYGSACQSLFSYRTSELANAKLTETQASWATTDEAISAITNEQVKGSCMAGFTVAAEYEIIPSFVYTGSLITEVAYANISYTDFLGNPVNYNINAEDFGDYSSTLKQIKVTGTAVADGASPITVTLCKEDGTVVDQSIDCVNYYAVRQLSKHDAYGALLKLIYSADIAFS